ncbi:MAG: S8 family serine peptidase [Saprospiraceae bacterium]
MKILIRTLVLSLCFSNTIFGQKATIDPILLDKFEEQKTVDYIVLMKDRVHFDRTFSLPTKQAKAEFVYQSLVEKSNITQKPIQQYLDSKKIWYQSFYVTNALKVVSDVQILYWIAQRDDVDIIMFDQPIKMLNYFEEKPLDFNRDIEPEWGIKMIKADSVWAMGYTGQGITIGGQDTGYSWNVSPLKSKYRGFVDSTTTNHDYHWHDAIHESNPAYPDSLINPCGFNTIAPCDDHNHGTHTMGTMVGEDDENKIGVAPGALWIGCRNMDRGWGKSSTYLECFEWLLAPYDLNGENADPSKAPHVINNSWYCSEEEGCGLFNFNLMNDVVTNLKSSGIVVVVSAGNSGSGCETIAFPPAIFEQSFTIGATTKLDTIAGYSSRGLVTIDSSFRMKPNVSAPGSSVRSVTRNGTFSNYSGTSMAGPHVAGLVALILSANPALEGEVETIESIIESTAINKTFDQDCTGGSGYSIPNAVYGFGRVDALGAVKKALSFVSSQKNIVSENMIHVFPNPSDGLISLLLKDDTETFLSVSIVNINGQVVYSDLQCVENTVKNLYLYDIPGGVYQYQVVTQNGKYFTGRFVKR